MMFYLQFGSILLNKNSTFITMLKPQVTLKRSVYEPHFEYIYDRLAKGENITCKIVCMCIHIHTKTKMQ